MSKIFKIHSGMFMLFAAIALNGCVSLLPTPGPAPNLISFTPQATSKIISAKSLLIAEPTCPIIYDGTKVVIQKINPTGLTYYTHANGQEWSERLPKMLQRTLINHFKSPNWPAVIDDAKLIGPDYRLMTDIRKFQIVSPGAVEVSINVTLFETKDRRVLVTKTFDYTLGSEDIATSYFLAFDKAVAQLLIDCDALLGGLVKN